MTRHTRGAQPIIARLTLTAVSLLHKGPLHTVQGKQYEQPFPPHLSLSLSLFRIQAINYTFDPIPRPEIRDERKSPSSIFALELGVKFNDVEFS